MVDSNDDRLIPKLILAFGDGHELMFRVNDLLPRVMELGTKGGADGLKGVRVFAKLELVKHLLASFRATLLHGAHYEDGPSNFGNANRSFNQYRAVAQSTGQEAATVGFEFLALARPVFKLAEATYKEALAQFHAK